MTNNHKKIVLWVAGTLAVLIIASVWLGRRAQPQLLSSDDVFKTVDALFTAVTAHNEKQLAECEQRLKRYKDAGELPDPAWKRLQGVIAKSRGGQWESAAQSLYDFMLGQRREGIEIPSSSSKLTASSGERRTVLRPAH
jgi:hypothetical protein